MSDGRVSTPFLIGGKSGTTDAGVLGLVLGLVLEAGERGVVGCCCCFCVFTEGAMNGGSGLPEGVTLEGRRWCCMLLVEVIMRIMGWPPMEVVVCCLKPIQCWRFYA